MKASFDISALKLAVDTASKIVLKKNQYSLAILGSVRIDATSQGVTVTATNIESSVTTPIVGATTISEGTVIIGHAGLSKLTKKLKKTHIDMILEDGKVTVTNGKFSQTVATMPVEEWPTIPVVEGQSITVDGTVLTRIASIASNDYSRPILTGVAFDDGSIVSTDSYRLTYVNDVETFDEPIIVPMARLVTTTGDTVAKHDAITVTNGDSDVSFTLPTGTVFTVRKIVGDFPNWRGLVPNQDNVQTMTFDRKEMLETVTRVESFIEGATPIRFNSLDGSVSAIERDDDDNVIETVERFDTYCAQNQCVDVVAFNGKYVIDGLKKVLEGDIVTLTSLDALKPSLLRGVGDDITYLLMPVRVN